MTIGRYLSNDSKENVTSTLTAAPISNPRLWATKLVTIATSKNMKNLAGAGVRE